MIDNRIGIFSVLALHKFLSLRRDPRLCPLGTVRRIQYCQPSKIRFDRLFADILNSLFITLSINERVM
jgi:hypothetical protein